MGAASDQQLSRVFLGWQGFCKVNWNDAKWLGIPSACPANNGKGNYLFTPSCNILSNHLRTKGNQGLPVITVLGSSSWPYTGPPGLISHTFAGRGEQTSRIKIVTELLQSCPLELRKTVTLPKTDGPQVKQGKVLCEIMLLFSR